MRTCPGLIQWTTPLLHDPISLTSATDAGGTQTPPGPSGAPSRRFVLDEDREEVGAGALGTVAVLRASLQTFD